MEPFCIVIFQLTRNGLGFSRLELWIKTPEGQHLVMLSDNVRLCPALKKLRGVRWPRIPSWERQRDELMASLYHYISEVVLDHPVAAIVVLENQNLAKEFGPISWAMLTPKKEKQSARIARLGLNVAFSLAKRLGASCFVSPVQEHDEGQLRPFEEAIGLMIERLHT